MADTTNKAQEMFNERHKSEKNQEETLLEIKQAILISTEQQAKFAARAEKFEEYQLAIQEEELKLRKMEVSRNRFSKLKAAGGLAAGGALGAYGLGKKMIQFDKRRQKSFAKLAFVEMISAGVITAIVTGVLGTAMFKKLFDNVSEENKQISRAIAAAVKAPSALKGGKMIAGGANSIIKDMRKPGVGLKQSLKNSATGFAKKQFDKYIMAQVRSIKSTYGFMADQAKTAGSAFVKGGGGQIATNLLGGVDEAAIAGSKVASATGVLGKAKTLGSGAAAMGKGAAGLGVKGTAKALGGGLIKGGVSAGAALGKGALAGGGKLALKLAKGIGGKVASKFIPGLGAVFSLYSGIDRWKKDDKVGAFIDFGSAVANLIPGLGGFLSLGLDLINMSRDFSAMPPQKQQDTLQKGRSIARHIPGLGLGISIADSVKMFANGDIKGGLEELAGGIASTIPGGRWAFDAGLELLDAFHGVENPMSGTAKSIKKFSKDQMKNMPIIGTFLRLKDAMKLWNQGKESDAMIEAAKAMGTMIPGVGLLYNFFEETKEPMATPSSGALQMGRGKVSKKEGRKRLGKLRKAITAGQAKGTDVSGLEARRDSLVTQMQNGGIPAPPKESEVKDEGGLPNVPGIGKSQLQRTNMNLGTLSDSFKPTAQSFVEAAWDAGYPVIVTEGSRGRKKQEAAKAAGNSNAGFGKSFHNYGMAFDIAFAGKDPYGSSHPWQAVGDLGKSMGLRWGGDFKSIDDKPHFETGNYTIAELKKTGLPMAAMGAIANTPTIAGEAGPEAIIPLNDRGVGVIAQALNKAMILNTVSGSKPTKSTDEFKSFLVDTFAKALASEIAKAGSKNKSSQQQAAPSVKVL